MAIARTNPDAVHLPPGEVAPVARERERRYVEALRRSPGTAADVVARTGLPQSVVYAELPLLVDREALDVHTVYTLPGQRVGAR